MMVILEIYTKHIKVKYKSTLLSKATFFVIMTNILGFVLPFVIAYKTGGLWQKRDVFHEQPQIIYNGEYLFIATTNNLEHPLVICTNYEFIIRRLNIHNMCSNIKVLQTDKDHDGKMDSMNFVLTTELMNDLGFNYINLVLPLVYKLKTVCPLEMKSAIVYQEYSGMLPLSKEISIFGDLLLKQSSAVICPKHGANKWLNIPIIKDDEYFLENNELENILQEYFMRNLSTYLANTFTIFKTKSQNNMFTINLRVNYPEHALYYKPRFWQIVKFAWIQYIAIYIVVVWVISKIKHYIFKNNLVIFYKEDPITKK